MAFHMYGPPPTSVEHADQIDGLVRRCLDTKLLGVDTETLGAFDKSKYGRNMTDKVVVASLSPDEDSRILVPARFLGGFHEVLEDPRIVKAVHNIKFDAHRFLNMGIKLGGPWACTLHLDFLADEDLREGRHSLDACMIDYFDIAMAKYMDLFGKADPRLFRPGHEKWGQYLDYATLDAWGHRKLAEYLFSILRKFEIDEDYNLENYYWEYDALQLKSIFALERNGIHLNKAKMKDLEVVAKGEIAGYQREMARLLSKPLNANSSNDLIAYFVEEMGFPVSSYTDTGQPQVNADYLKRVRKETEGKTGEKGIVHQVADLVLKTKRAGKLLSTYVIGYSELVDADGRIRTSYSTTKVTGRLGSSAPNLQNCFDGDTEVLTPNGWVRLSDYEEGVKVAQWSGGNITYVEPEAFVRQIYKGEMVHVTGDFTDLLMTPGHRWFVWHPETGEELALLASDPIPLGHQLRHAANPRGASAQAGMVFAPDKCTADRYQSAAVMAGQASYVTPRYEAGYVRGWLVQLGPAHTETEQLRKTLVPWDSEVFCVTVPSGKLVIRRAGKTTVTGNCPRPDNDHYGIRDLFAAEPGHKLIVIDYSQLEMRILAHMAGEQKMCDAIRAGLDMHCFVAAQMYGYSYEEMYQKAKVEEDPKFAAMRTDAKAIGFGIVYGKTAHGLAIDFGITKTEAQARIDRFLDTFPGIRRYMDRMKAMALSQGYVQTITGRPRRLSAIRSDDWGYRGSAERKAINAPIQGSAADIMKKSLITIWMDARLRELGYEPMMQVHDEIVGQAPGEHAEECAKIIKDILETPFINPLDVPLHAEPAIVDTWKEGK